MNQLLSTLLFSLSLLSLALSVPARSAGLQPAAPPQPQNEAAPTPPPGEDEDEEQVKMAVLSAIEGSRQQVLGLLVNEIEVETVRLSTDRASAAAWLRMRDPQTGELLPGEPGLAMAKWVGDQWQVTLPSDPGWVQQIEAAPYDVLSEEARGAWLEMYQAEASQAPSASLGGYLLPWAAGQTVWVSQTVLHDKYIPSGSAHFSFDFYIPQTMFRLYASKAGTVWRARWDVPNGDDSGVGNYLVLQDATTNPVSYQLYLHLAQDTIPPALRETGATVVQGQFIGLADDTGQSTGHHLHFQVHINPDSYWGTAVDITFQDVAINGGRPRISADKPFCKSTDVCEQFQASYISGNVVAGDIVPPTGGVLEPLNGAVVKTKSLNVEAWASDEGSGLEKSRLIAYFNEAWQEIGPEFTGNLFSFNWDLCAAAVPDGPVSLALQVWDNEGNLSFGLPGLTHFVKDFNCSPPPPDCSPSEQQVALFSAPDFGGVCTLIGPGSYPNSASFGILGDDNVAAIQVGSQVLATLYTDADYAGRGETLAAADANLADNLVGTDTATSLKVRLRSEPPPRPTILITPHVNQVASFPAGASFSLAWRDPGGATGFQAQLFKGAEVVKTSGWLATPVWYMNDLSLEAGAFTWKVRARNCETAACQSNWSDPASFTITAGAAPPSGVSAPFEDTVESGLNGWTPTGLWNRLNDSGEARSGTYSWYYGKAVDRDYKDGSPNTGDLTSRPVTIPGEGYVLRFWYRYITEGAGQHWDQRWVQISANGGPFVNVLQLWDDAPDYWLRSEIDLSAYTGDTIRVRFHFATLDGAFNGYEGWHIDDIGITSDALPACSDTDNQPENAIAISFGQTLSGSICPSGDVDYYTFAGTAGDRIAVNVDSNTENPPGDLDLILFLLDADGKSGLAQQDDEVPGELFDPHLGYQLTRTGTYFLKLRLWAHPSSGGEAYSYTLGLSKDQKDPSASFANPPSGAFLPDQASLALSASDSGSGISHVEFRYHPSDWLNGAWQTLGTDWDGSDGWSFSFDASGLVQGHGMAFFAGVYDRAGNWTGTGTWNLGIDRTAPVTALKPLETTQSSTAVQLAWSSSDNLSGLDYYSLQSKKGSAPWIDFPTKPAGADEGTWFIGEAGSSYAFRMRGADKAGNLESYPDTAETSTNIPSATTLCANPDAWDSGKNDNSPATATPVQVDGDASTHNFCNPLAGDWGADEDWVWFNVEASDLYLLKAVPVAESAAGTLELYAADGTTLLQEAGAAGFGEVAQIAWTADRNGRVYLRVRHLDGRVIGAEVSYQIVVRKDYKVYLPFVNKES